MSDKAVSKDTAVQREAQAVTPAVDVYEDEQGIVLTADLPGVSGDRLNLQVDDDTLTIEAEAEFDIPENLNALHAELRASRYRRSFSISRELDSENINADFKHGVLKITLPKRKEHQPRKITVSAA